MNAGTTMTSSNDTEAPAKKNCPSCDRSGKIVAAITLDSLLTDEAKKRVPDKDGFRFCGTPDCPVAYYRSDDGMILETGEVRVSVFQKSSDPSRFACYCFNHSVEAIEVEVRRSGKSTPVPRRVMRPGYTPRWSSSRRPGPGRRTSAPPSA